MTEGEQIIQRLKESFDGEPWYGTSLTGVLAAIPFRHVTIKCEPSQNNIARLVTHMLNWREFAIKKLQGDGRFDIELNSNADWPESGIKNESEWNSLCQRLTESQETIIFLLSKIDETGLSKQVPGKLYDFRFLIEGLIQHDIYHLGQIALIDRLLNQM
jgi:uncharacterized damage-inducible protein DinB